MDETSGTRRITEYKLLEYSTLSFLGANENTPCVGIKSESAITLKEEITLLDEMLRKGDYSDEKFKQIETKISEIQNKIKEFNSLTIEEPLKDTQEIVEPDTLFKEIDFSEIINNINLK